MADGILLIASLTFHEGKHEKARAALEALVRTVRETDDKTQTLQYEAHISEDGTSAVMLERYVDTEALRVHVEHAGKVITQVMAVTTTDRVQVIGEVPEQARQWLAILRPTYYSLAFSQAGE